ncbi:hypothetical protein CDR68_17105 [Salmonella enterica]|nr:hypothetical protein [Salmonella enterica]
MRSIGYVFGAFVIMPIIIIIINVFFFRGNKVTQEQITQYVNDSKVIEVYIPKTNYDEIDEDAFHRGNETKQNYERYRTGLSRKGSHTGRINRFIFFSKKYNKYLVLLTFNGFDYSGDFNTDKNDLRDGVVWDGHYFMVRVNNKQWNHINYGTEVNPVPVFCVTLSGRGFEDKGPGVLEEQRSFSDVSDDLNRVFVGQYLNYFLPEEEFEKFFAE